MYSSEQLTSPQAVGLVSKIFFLLGTESKKKLIVFKAELGDIGL